MFVSIITSFIQVSLPTNEMTLSVHVAPTEATARDTYAVYVSYGMNESTIVPPTESNFDFVFYLPNTMSNSSVDDEDELQYTIFMSPTVHRGNGTYIFGVRRILKDLRENNSTYRIGMYVSGCQYWNEQKYIWSQDGCQVMIISLSKSNHHVLINRLAREQQSNQQNVCVII